MPTDRFSGKVAVVTGAASGIGRAVTLRLAGEGAAVLAHDLNAEGLDETARLAKDAGAEIVVRAGDVSSRDECRATVDQAVTELGRLDILGNIAGIARGEHFVDVSEAAYRQMMGVNVDGYFFLSQAAVPHLLETDGSIINIASNAGIQGQAYTVTYCASKGAVILMTKALAMEFAKTRLRVNAIAPGGVNTSLVAGYQMPPDVDWNLVGRYTGQREMATPEDIASLFAYVASDEARNIHGAILSCDGGLTAG